MPAASAPTKSSSCHGPPRTRRRGHCASRWGCTPTGAGGTALAPTCTRRSTGPTSAATSRTARGETFSPVSPPSQTGAPAQRVLSQGLVSRQPPRCPVSMSPGSASAGRASSSIVTQIPQHSHRIGSVQLSIRTRNGDDSPIEVISSASSSSPRAGAAPTPPTRRPRWSAARSCQTACRDRRRPGCGRTHDLCSHPLRRSRPGVDRPQRLAVAYWRRSASIPPNRSRGIMSMAAWPGNCWPSAARRRRPRRLLARPPDRRQSGRRRRSTPSSRNGGTHVPVRARRR